MKLRKKLIEVALPLDAINKASAHEKMPGIGPHPRGLHLWWARRPLAAARAVIFSQMVDDPSEYVDVLKSDPKLRRRAENELKKRHKVWEEQTATKERADAAGIESPDPGPEPTLDDIIGEQERDRLFRIIEKLVLWENTTNETVLEEARAEIWQSWRRACADNADHPRAKELFDRDKLPAFHDPFAGGGALPLEAQRLGLEAYASDLNPVAVLINKAMIEIPPKFAGMPPVNPEWQSKPEAEKAMKVWRGAEGLAEDVRYYGKWMRDEAEKRIGHLYPKVEVTEEMAKVRPDLKQYVGKKLTVIAWLWARTVKSPNPAFSTVDVPLVSNFMLANKTGKESYVVPQVKKGGYEFKVCVGKPDDPSSTRRGTKTGGSHSAFRCLMSNTPIPFDYIRSEGRLGRISERLMAIVAVGDRGRVYLDPSADMESVARQAIPNWAPETPLPNNPRNFNTPIYGLDTYGKLFTPRQLVALSTLSELISKVHSNIREQIPDVGFGSIPNIPNDYADAVCVYLAFGVDRCADFSNTCTRWVPGNQKVMNLFGKQAIGMTWDYPEAAILEDTVGGFVPATAFISKCLKTLPAFGNGVALQKDATTGSDFGLTVVSTDPPYYNNIAYAELSDFFYVWLRRNLKSIIPGSFSTIETPKNEELVATPYRHEGQENAERFFLNGMTRAMQRVAENGHPAFPVTIYYAVKQSENSDAEGTTNTGWDTFLAAVIQSGFAITGTWPLRSEQEFRMIGIEANALASSIVLVCQKRLGHALTVTRRDFISALKSELPEALRYLQRGNIAPVDLAQAAIGPGMAVFTRYEKVLDAEGEPLSVRDALALINQTLDEVLAEQEGDFDADTRWALAWFEEFGFEAGEYGRAEVLSKAKVTSITEMADPRTSPILEAKAGKVRLFRPEELEEDWTPEGDGRLTVWDMVHQLIRVLEKDGETAAAAIVAKLGARAETARELCYRLYTLCERKKRAPEALSYNALVQSWPEIMRLAQQQTASTGGTVQTFEFTEQE